MMYFWANIGNKTCVILTQNRKSGVFRLALETFLPQFCPRLTHFCNTSEFHPGILFYIRHCIWRLSNHRTELLRISTEQFLFIYYTHYIKHKLYRAYIPTYITKQHIQVLTSHANIQIYRCKIRRTKYIYIFLNTGKLKGLVRDWVSKEIGPQQR